MSLASIVAYILAVASLLVFGLHGRCRWANVKLHPSLNWIGKPLVGLGAAVLALYFATLGGLLAAWYVNNGVVAFHWFDDGAEWLGMDKLGHAFTTFWVCQAAFVLIRQHVATQLLAARWAGIIAWVLISSYESFDGLSPAYGASPYDMLANAVGATTAAIQLAKYADVLIFPRLSFMPTAWAAFRPNVLGSTFSEQLLKDYNGQTYWLNLNPHYLLGWGHWPRWLAITVGYGAEGMVYGRVAQCHQHGYDPLQQFYITLAIDPSWLIESNHRWVRRAGRTLRYVQIPLPGMLFQTAPWLADQLVPGLQPVVWGWFF